MIGNLLELLKNHPDVAQWSVLHTVRREWQHYLIKESPEATREVEQEAYAVTLFHKHGEAMGSTTVTLSAADEAFLRERIEEGLLAASLTNNEPWSLPKPAEFPQVPLTDEEALADPQAAIETYAERMLAAVRREEHIRLSAAEFFLEETTSTIYNSEGVHGMQKETLFLLEFVLLANNGVDAETEHFVMEKRRRLADLPIEDVIAEHAKHARDSIRAELPKTWKGPVVIDSGALIDMLLPLRYHATGRSKYMKISQAQVGENFLGDREVMGDPLNVKVTTAMPYGVESYRFSEEGLPGRETVLVENNVFRNYLVDQRYADYLGVEPTSDSGTLVLQAGELSHEQLLKGPVYYVVAFSAMMPSPFTGNFAAELKLAYYIDEEGNRTPVKGGSLSGNLFEGLTDVLYARETVFTGAYSGPKSVRFNELTIAGEET